MGVIQDLFIGQDQLTEKWKISREKAKKDHRAKNWKKQGARMEIVKGAESMDPP